MIEVYREEWILPNGTYIPTVSIISLSACPELLLIENVTIVKRRLFKMKLSHTCVLFRITSL